MEEWEIGSASRAAAFDSRTNFKENMKFCSIDEVRIIPGKLMFLNAYDGKSFTESFKIINAGKYPALVRVLPPSSKAFHMKALQRGCYLPSGISITRTIKFTYTRGISVPQACIPIYINEKPLIYELEVLLSCAYVSLQPKLLDFGDIDVGNASEQLTIQMTNKGHKNTQFVVDLGRNDLELIVDPMRGMIQPQQTVEVKCELLGSQAETFMKEFWIKTEPPQRVILTGTFITPKLVIEHPLTDYSLTLIEFPKTYYGAENKRTVVIRNASSIPAMFCTVAEHADGFVCLDKARKFNKDVKAFYIKPKEGRLEAQHKYILNIAFTPSRVKICVKNHCITFLRIIKLNYRSGTVQEKDVEVKTFSSNVEMEHYSIASLESVNIDESSTINIDDGWLRLCLYGEIERASVQLRPDALEAPNLKTMEVTTFTFNVKNNSKQLPITVKYNKLPGIEMIPSVVYLQPDGNKDVELLLKPSQVGKFEINIRLSLVYLNEDNVSSELGISYIKLNYSAVMCDKSLVKTKPYFNPGITPTITHEVGFLVEGIRFNSNIEKPRQAVVSDCKKLFGASNTDLVAFPNDRPKSLRPWKSNVRCTTIFAKIPRATERLNSTKATKTRSSLVSEKSIHLKNISKPDLPDYETTENNDFLLKNEISRRKCERGPWHEPEENMVYFIPLTPEDLLAIHIKPKFVMLGKIAPYTSCSDSFRIENTNTFPVHVTIRALSNSVVIKGKKRIIIKAKTTRNIYFDCYSHGIGKYYVPVYIIINDTHIFDATVFAEVVPTTVKCNEKEIYICPKRETAFFEIMNPVNCEIKYAVNIQDKNFQVEPAVGYISARSRMILRVSYVHLMNPVYNTEMYLLSQSGAKQIIKVIYKNEKERIQFSTDVVKFENIPLNTSVSEDVIIRNFSDRTVIINVSDPQPIDCVFVKPQEGLVKHKSDMVLNITVLCKSVIEFKCKVEIIINKTSYFVNILGKVEYPDVKFEPDVLQIPKIVSGAYHRRVFKVTNNSRGKVFLNFDLANYPEFRVTDLQGYAIPQDLTLRPGLSQELFLEFRPSEPVAYCIFLPYILNGIIGPPQLNNPSSLNPQSYLLKMNDCVLSECPQSIPAVKIRCAAGAPWVYFSTLELNFIKHNGRCQTKFFVQNISTIEQTLTLDCEDIIESPFSISLGQQCCSKSMSKLSQSIAPCKKITFTCTYDPIDYGKHEYEIPVFLEKYFESCPFNYLKLFGNYPNSVIKTEIDTIYFPTVRVNSKHKKDVKLYLYYHKENCIISYEKALDHIFVKLGQRTDVGKEIVSVDVTITFRPSRECIVDTSIMFTCTCGGECHITVRCDASTSILLLYEDCIEETSNLKLKSTFPLFPNGEDPNYLHEMTVIVQILEKFLSRSFYSANYFKIPDTISRCPDECSKTGYPKTKVTKGQYLPLVQFLINLTNESVLNYILDGKWLPPDDPLKNTIFEYNIYSNITEFLKTQGVFVQELKPEFLLTFSKYRMYKEQVTQEDTKDMQELETEDSFYLRSKQCWVDLILKTYKVFVFERIIRTRENQEIVHQIEFNKYADAYKYQYSDIDPNEAVLMMWLTYHFEKEKHILWPDFDLPTPKVRSFDTVDSSLLVTAITAYCPYLIENFKDFYINEPNQGQLYNNAFLVYDTWQKMNMCLECDTKSIYKPHPIQMLMTLTYLYDILPYYYPTETLFMDALIGDTSSYIITVKNVNSFTIYYKIIFFSNDMETFTTDKKMIVVPAKQRKQLKIFYRAKHVLKSDAVLLLSGETGEVKYATSKTYNLVGIPNIFNSFEEHTIRVNIYEMSDHILKIKSPYENSYIAKTYFYFKPETVVPKSLDEFVSQQKLHEDHVPYQISLDDTVLFDTKGEATVHLKTCFITSGTYDYFTYFLNEEVGDYCIKITIETNISKHTFEEVSIKYYLSNSSEMKCSCRNSSTPRTVFSLSCPFTKIVEIPCRNRYLMEGLRAMLKVYADGVEFDFWSKHLTFPKGLRIFCNYVLHTFDQSMTSYKEVLNNSASYKVEMEDDSYSVLPEVYNVADVTSENSIKVLIHQNFQGNPKDTFMKLISESGMEIRTYKLLFVAK